MLNVLGGKHLVFIRILGNVGDFLFVYCQVVTCKVVLLSINITS